MAGCPTPDLCSCLPQEQGLLKNQVRSCVSSRTKKVEAGAQSQGLRKSQVYLCSGLPLGTRGMEACPLNVLDPLPHLERQRE